MRFVDHANHDTNSFYSGPLRGVFSTLRRRDILRNVQTLVLDGLSVTSELCHEIINGAAFNVRVLSIRDVKNLNQGKLRGTLQYACRNTRPKGTPKLKALYVFGSKDVLSVAQQPASSGTSISAGWNQKSQDALAASLQKETDAWWTKKGRIINKPIDEEWANCMLACEGIIAFDAVLCRSPRHRNSSVFGKDCGQVDGKLATATFAVPACDNCGDAPEGICQSGTNLPIKLPVLSPVPLLSSSIRAATTPHDIRNTFVPRCLDCLRERYCTGCQKWWCESCYQLPGQGSGGYSNQVVIVDDETVDAFGNLALETPAVKVKVRNGFCELCTRAKRRGES